MKQKIWILLTLFWMCVIFFFSSRSGELSGQDSHRVGYVIGSFVLEDFDALSEEAKQDFAKSISYPVRKGAHMSEYAILAFLVFHSFASHTQGRTSESQRKELIQGDRRRTYRTWIVLTALVCFLYAISDEAHQFFVGGRNASFIDVLIDTAGASLMLLLLWMKHRRSSQ